MEKKLVNFRVKEERRERWKEAVEESNEYRSMTHMIVMAVENELFEDSAEPSTEVTFDVDLEEMKDSVEEIEEQVEEMGDGIDRLFRVIGADEEDYVQITGRVQELIPTGGREAILKKAPDAPPKDTEDLEAEIRRTGSVEHVVRLIQEEQDVSPLVIRDAVERLADSVVSIELTYADPQEEDDKRVYRVRR